MKPDMTAGSIDPETVAAFLDGKLSASERDRVMRALISSPDLYETFIEARAIRDELATIREPIKIHRFADALRKAREIRLKPLQVALPIAAALAGVLVVGRIVMAPDGPQALSLIQDATWLASAQQHEPQPALASNLSSVNWPASRSANVTGAPANAAFGSGVLLVNYEVAATIGDSASALSAAADLKRTLDQVPGGGPAAALATAPPTPSVRSDLSQALAELFDNSPWYDLGIWLGQARLAAAVGDLPFFAPAGPAAKALNDVRDQLAVDPAIGNDANSQASLDHIDAFLNLIKTNQSSTATALSDSLAEILATAASSRQ